ncbi:outer membrane protein transport protein [Bacteroidia bacterium]|nr:outer membrane protein transport protein [Bacteroidia bacterium]MDB9883081.1 outer membrane protein transport protein [Bacteroidia bacterium]
MKQIMKNSLILLAIFGMIIIGKVEAQSEVDALRFSLTPSLGTTARALGLGGAIGALGADQSAVLSNPAGLAQYKNNSFNISVGTVKGRNQATYLDGANKTANSYVPELPSINVVWTKRKMVRGNPSKTGWVNTNFQVGYNRLADFNRNTSYKGANSKNSYTDYVADYVQGLDVSALDANDEQLEQGFYYYDNMFWYAYLIDSLSNGNYYANYDAAAPGGISQNGQIIKKGGMGEYNTAFAANYEHKVYFGASLNVNRVNYSEKNTFSETDNALTTGNWNSFDFTRNLETKGYGFSGRLGVIFRPNSNFRIGATIQTPTKLMLNDAYSDELYVLEDDGLVTDVRTIDKEFIYTVTTPGKYGLQGAYIFGKRGLISAEIESVDYSAMNLSSSDNLFDDTNDEIVDKYQNATNIKIGGEYVLNSFRLRAGFASVGNPLANEGDYSRNILSGGFGIQEKNWAFDFGMARDFTSDVYVPYTITGVESVGVENTLSSTKLMITITNKF